MKDIFSLFLNENIYCVPSLEPSRRDGSNEGSQNTFNSEIGEIVPYDNFSYFSTKTYLVSPY